MHWDQEPFLFLNLHTGYKLKETFASFVYPVWPTVQIFTLVFHIKYM
jgi:hypothetical protein